MQKPKICRSCGKEVNNSYAIVAFCSPKCYDKHLKERDKERKKIANEKKKVSISTLTIKADKVLSEYTRKRDCIKTSGTVEKGVCITCWETKNYEQFDAGHFITRASRSTRWQEQNVNTQCKACNWWGSGRQYEHGLAIDKKYWEGTADILVRLWHEPQKVTREFLEEIIREYTEKLYNL